MMVPTLIITGDEDDGCIQPSLFLKQTIPASGLAMFAKTGHILNLEEPALFNETLARGEPLAAARSCFQAGVKAERQDGSSAVRYAACTSKPALEHGRLEKDYPVSARGADSSDVSIAGRAHVGRRDLALLPAEMPYDIVTDGSDLRVGIGSSERRHKVVAPGRPDLNPFKHSADEIDARRVVHGG